MNNAGCTPVKWILLASTFSPNPKSKLDVNTYDFTGTKPLIWDPMSKSGMNAYGLHITSTLG